MEMQARLSLLRLTSPALPVGGFSYSRGLEHAVELGWVSDAASACDWIGGVLERSVCPLDGAVFVRMWRALDGGDHAGALRWNAWLAAARESAELQAEEQHMGRALVRLLVDMDVLGADALPRDSSLALAFAFACQAWSIPLEEGLAGYFFAFVEAQVSAAIRLVPLGQTDGQRILVRLQPAIERCVREAMTLHDDDIGSLAPGLAMASCWHETQYSRLFRS